MYWKAITTSALFSISFVYASPLAPSQSAHSVALLKRGRPIPNYIVCHGLVPNQGDFPPGFSRSTYPDMQSLCALYSAQKNLACMCEDPDGVPRCHAAWADAHLWSSDRLRYHCDLKCACASTKPPLKGKDWVSSTRSDHVSTNTGWESDDSLSSNEEMIDWNDHGDGSEQSWNSRYTTTERHESRGGARRVHRRPPVQAPAINTVGTADVKDLPGASCNIQCSSDDVRCGNQRFNEKPCRCFALQASAGAYFFKGLCATRMPWTKRDEDGLLPVGCACNGTYVSKRCCDDDVLDGLVWEAAERKLGELQLD